METIGRALMSALSSEILCPSPFLPDCNPSASSLEDVPVKCIRVEFESLLEVCPRLRPKTRNLHSKQNGSKPHTGTIQQKRGSAMLVGVGGSGKQSLARHRAKFRRQGKRDIQTLCPKPSSIALQKDPETLNPKPCSNCCPMPSNSKP